MTTAVAIETPQFDARFPNTNQTKNCWQNWVDFHKCTEAKGEGFPVCQKFKKTYRSLCPNDWVERWETERSEGRSPSF